MTRSERRSELAAIASCAWLAVGCGRSDALLPVPGAIYDAPSLGAVTSTIAGGGRAQPTRGLTAGLTRAQASQSCQNACTVAASCGFSFEPLCDAQCEAALPIFEAHDCVEQAAAENDCLSSMSCGELAAYGEDGRRDNRKCGAQARAFFADCTLDGGAVPAECTAMCAQYLACDLLEIAVSACEETCVGNATGFGWRAGEGCSAAFLDFASCVSEVSCDDLQIMLDTRLSPPSCAAQVAQFDAQCQ